MDAISVTGRRKKAFWCSACKMLDSDFCVFMRISLLINSLAPSSQNPLQSSETVTWERRRRLAMFFFSFFFFQLLLQPL